MAKRKRDLSRFMQEEAPVVKNMEQVKKIRRKQEKALKEILKRDEEST